MKRNLKNKVTDALLGFIVGDIYGVPYEFIPPERIKHPIELTSGGSHNQPLGSWSDDTSLVLATIDSINEQNDIDISDIKKKFCEWLNNAKYTSNNQVFDVGNTTIQAIRDNNPGTDTFSNGNGSLMRMLPIALYTYKMKRYQYLPIVKLASSITHAHQTSIHTCLKYVEYFHLLMDGHDKYEALESIMSLSHTQYLNINDLDTKGYVKTTLHAAIWCFLITDNYKDSIIKAISLGHDTDTVAAITGSLSGLYYGDVCDTDKILNGKYAKKLIKKFVDELYI